METFMFIVFLVVFELAIIFPKYALHATFSFLVFMFLFTKEHKVIIECDGKKYTAVAHSFIIPHSEELGNLEFFLPEIGETVTISKTLSRFPSGYKLDGFWGDIKVTGKVISVS
jgi:hypothetical protein